MKRESAAKRTPSMLFGAFMFHYTTLMRTTYETNAILASKPTTPQGKHESEEVNLHLLQARCQAGQGAKPSGTFWPLTKLQITLAIMKFIRSRPPKHIFLENFLASFSTFSAKGPGFLP